MGEKRKKRGEIFPSQSKRMEASVMCKMNSVRGEIARDERER